jgi:hypothetical protein
MQAEGTRVRESIYGLTKPQIRAKRGKKGECCQKAVKVGTLVVEDVGS